MRSHAKGLDNCLVQWALRLKTPLYSQYGNHTAVRIQRCVLVGNVKGPVVITISHAACSKPTGHGDNVRQTADTISFSILKSTLVIDDAGVRLKPINHTT